MTPPSEITVSLTKVWEIGNVILTVAVLPTFFWVNTLSNQNVLRDAQISHLQAEVQDLRKHEEEFKRDLNDISIHLARLEEKTDAVNQRLDAIKDLLRK